MADYIFEVGIDRHAEPGSDGTYPLFFNICHPNHPGWSTNFLPGETFEWHFFDYTEAPDGSPEEALAVVGFTMKMVYAMNRKILVPILPQVPLCYGENYITTESGIQPTEGISSEIFPNIQHGWNLPYEIGESATFTFPTPQTPSHGRIILGIGLIVTIPTINGRELRHYGHDPEIIVGPGT